MQFQNNERKVVERQTDDLLFDPKVCAHISDAEMQNYLDLACSAVVKGKGYKSFHIECLVLLLLYPFIFLFCRVFFQDKTTCNIIDRPDKMAKHHFLPIISNLYMLIYSRWLLQQRVCLTCFTIMWWWSWKGYFISHGGKSKIARGKFSSMRWYDG